MDNRDFYIFGQPIKTEFGLVRFLTYQEYLLNNSELSLISQNVLHLYYLYRKQIEKENNSKEALEEFKSFKEQKLYDVVLSTNYILESYIKILKLVLDNNGYSDDDLEDVIYSIFSSEDSFLQIRNIIMDMNVLTEEEVNPTEEIQRFIEHSRTVKQQGAPKQTPIDIITSIVAGTPHSFEDVMNMNVMQVYALYARLGAFFNYQTTTLFATVAEKVNVELWNKHIDLFEKESHVISHEKFMQTTGKIFSD